MNSLLDIILHDCWTYSDNRCYDDHDIEDVEYEEITEERERSDE